MNQLNKNELVKNDCSFDNRGLIQAKRPTEGLINKSKVVDGFGHVERKGLIKTEKDYN